MGLFDFLKPARQRYKYAQMLNGRMPIFSHFGTNIYASDVVQQACFCIVQECKKLNPRHIKSNGVEPIPVRGRVQSVLNHPNAIMTRSEFLERITWASLLNYNAWVIKVKDRAHQITALWPVNPARVTYIEDAAGTLCVTLEFDDGTKTTGRYGEDVVNVKHHYFANDYMGGDANGQPDNAAILETLELNDTLMQGVSKGLKASYAINGAVKYNTIMDNGTMEANIRDLEEHLLAGESGFLPLDLKGEFIQMQRDIKMVDKDTLEFIDSKILRHYGVPLPILTGDYTSEQLAAFYQKTIEPFVVSLAQAFTLLIFSPMEIAHNNTIEFYPAELIFMSTTQKLEMVKELGPTGTMYENEKRRIFGMVPLPELVGVRMQSLNYVDQRIAVKYQLSKQEKEAEPDAEDEETDQTGT